MCRSGEVSPFMQSVHDPGFRAWNAVPQNGATDQDRFESVFGGDNTSLVLSFVVTIAPATARQTTVPARPDPPRSATDRTDPDRVTRSSLRSMETALFGSRPYDRPQRFRFPPAHRLRTSTRP